METDNLKYIIFILAKAQKLCKAGQTLFKVNGYRVFIMGDYVKVILGPFLLWNNKYVLVRTILTILGYYLALLPDKPECWNFQDSKVWVKLLAYGMFIIYVFYLCYKWYTLVQIPGFCQNGKGRLPWNVIFRTIAGPCQDHVATVLGLALLSG